MNSLPAMASTGPLTGTEFCQYEPGFLSSSEADDCLQSMEKVLDWCTERLTIYGRSVMVPRQVAWCGDPGLNYRYSGLDHLTSGWPPEFAELTARLQQACAVRFNFVLANRYRNGQDYMGWHRDNEAGLANLVASLSLGGSRRFLIRPSGEKVSKRLELGHGSLLIFDGAMRHSLPRCVLADRRINLTFRCLQGDEPR